MDNEEPIFDFMAAAEDTGKRLDALLKVIPGSLQKTLSAEYQHSPWLTTLPAEVERLSAVMQRGESAAECAGSAMAHMERRIKTVCFVAFLAIAVSQTLAPRIARKCLHSQGLFPLVFMTDRIFGRNVSHAPYTTRPLAPFARQGCPWVCRDDVLGE